MGLFSLKKTVAVSSTVYNLAGDEIDRPNYLKSSMFSAVLNPTNSKQLVGETLVNNYLSGPGIKQRNFFNWAVSSNYDGLPSASIDRISPLDKADVIPHIPLSATPDVVPNVQSVFITDADYTYHSEKYMMDNHPTLYKSNWVSDYDSNTGDITIQFEDTTSVVFTPSSYDISKRYIIAYYYEIIPERDDNVVNGSTTVGESNPSNLPDNTGFSLVSTTDLTTTSYSLEQETEVVKTYSDSTPSTTDTTYTYTPASYTKTKSEYFKSEYQGVTGTDNETYVTETTNIIDEYREVESNEVVTVEYNDMGGGVTETVTTTVTTETLSPLYDYTVNYKDVISSTLVGNNQLFIYEIGSGNSILDALEETQVSISSPEFYPTIPIRLDNVSITDTEYVNNGLYADAYKAYRKSMGYTSSFTGLVDNVEENEDLDEIDYSYIMYGVPLNVIENSSRKFIYNFLKSLISYQTTNGTTMANFIADVGIYETKVAELQVWMAAQSDILDPLYGTSRPELPSLEEPETSTLAVRSFGPTKGILDNRLTWISIEEEVFTGLGKIDAVKDEVWIEKGTLFEWESGYDFNSNTEFPDQFREQNEIEEIFIYHQVSDTSYKRLHIYGLTHRNYIYEGKSVKITAYESLDDNDISGFIIPLHQPTLKSMSIVDVTQMSTSNSYIVFNSYKIYKQKWYQTFLFKIVIVIAIIALAVYIGPAAYGAVPGLLGTNLAVGAALGLTGISAIIAGAIANAIAALILTKVISLVSTELLGDQIGSIVAAVTTFIAMTVIAGGLDPSSFSSFLSTDKILQLTNVLANAYSGYTQANIENINQKIIENREEYESELDYIKNLMSELTGTNNLYFDPLTLTDTSKGNDSSTIGGYVPESLDEFIHRTTMTGDDIVEVTLAMVNEYSDLNLILPRN